MHLDKLLVLADSSDPVLDALPPEMARPVDAPGAVEDFGLVIFTARRVEEAPDAALSAVRRRAGFLVGMVRDAPEPGPACAAFDLILVNPHPDRAGQLLGLAQLLGALPTLVRHLRELDDAPDRPAPWMVILGPDDPLRAAARALTPPDGALRHALLVLLDPKPEDRRADVDAVRALWGGVLRPELHQRPGPPLALLVAMPLHEPPRVHEGQRAVRPARVEPPPPPALEAVAPAVAPVVPPPRVPAPTPRMTGGGPPRLIIPAPVRPELAIPRLSFEAEHVSADQEGAAEEEHGGDPPTWSRDPMPEMVGPPGDEGLAESAGPDGGAEPPDDVPAPAPATRPGPPMISTLAEAFVQSGLPARPQAELVVRAGFRPPARGETGISVVAETPEGTEVEVRVEATPADAATISPERARVQLRPDGYSEMARFVVVPRAEGRLKLQVSFDRSVERLAALPIELVVGTETQPALDPASTGGALAVRVGPPEDEERYLLRLVVLSEQDDRELLRFEWTAPDFTGPRGAPHPLDSSLRDHCRNLYTREKVEGWYQWYARKDQATGERRVAQDGFQLAQQLLPPEVSAVIQALLAGDEPRVLEVEETRSTLVPWEMLAFQMEDGHFRFLVESLILARRPAGARLNRLRRSPVLVAGELSGAEAGLAAPLGQVLPAVSSSFDLDEHLFGPAVRPLGVLYLTAHGASRPQEQGGPKVYFPDGSTLEPNQLAGSEALRGTLVVMASCHAAEAQEGLLGDLGWVSQLKSVGAEAIIAPLWDVDRKRSELFCGALFSALAAGESLGRAVNDARAACRAAGGPDWLAWTLWGDPTLRG